MVPGAWLKIRPRSLLAAPAGAQSAPAVFGAIHLRCSVVMVFLAPAPFSKWAFETGPHAPVGNHTLTRETPEFQRANLTLPGVVDRLARDKVPKVAGRFYYLLLVDYNPRNQLLTKQAKESRTSSSPMLLYS